MIEPQLPLPLTVCPFCSRLQPENHGVYCTYCGKPITFQTIVRDRTTVSTGAARRKSPTSPWRRILFLGIDAVPYLFFGSLILFLAWMVFGQCRIYLPAIFPPETKATAAARAPAPGRPVPSNVQASYPLFPDYYGVFVLRDSEWEEIQHSDFNDRAYNFTMVKSEPVILVYSADQITAFRYWLPNRVDDMGTLSWYLKGLDVGMAISPVGEGKHIVKPKSALEQDRHYFIMNGTDLWGLVIHD